MDGARISDQLRYMTVRILTSRHESTDWSGAGTGFMYAVQKSGINIPLLVTNKHVVNDAIYIGLKFHLASSEGDNPLPGPGRLITFRYNQIPIFRHPDPDVDLAAIALLPLAEFAITQQNWKPFIKCLGPFNLPSLQMIAQFGALEDIIMVGYPTGIVDDANNYPIIRRGITSTPFSANYQGKSEFLADIAVYGGSSGSPVFVLNEGSWAVANGMAMGTRFALLGVLYAGHTETVNGQIVAEPIPTNLGAFAQVTHMINLGLCIKSSRIEELGAQIPTEMI